MHHPLDIPVPVIRDLTSLPYAKPQKRYVDHVEGCDVCYPVFDDDELAGQCHLYCPTGHELLHAMDNAVQEQWISAQFN